MKNKLLKISAFITAFTICFTALPVEAIATTVDVQNEITETLEDISYDTQTEDSDLLESEEDSKDTAVTETEDEELSHGQEDDFFSVWEDDSQLSEDEIADFENEELDSDDETESLEYDEVGYYFPPKDGPEDGIYFDMAKFTDRYSDEWDAVRTGLWTNESHSVDFYIDKEIYDYVLKNANDYRMQVARGWDWDYILDFYEEREGAEGWSGDYMFYHTTLSAGAAMVDWDKAHEPGYFTESFYTYDGKEYYKMNNSLGVDNYPGFDISKEPEVEEIVSNLVGPGGELDVTKYKSDAAKIKAAYNWVVSNVSYTSGYNSNENSIYYFAYAGFTEGKGSCECMAQCFYYICRKMGVGVRILFNNVGHVYNMARVGNSWYYVDCSAKKCLKGTGSMGTFKPHEMILPTWSYDYRVFKANYLDLVPRADYTAGTMLYSDTNNLKVRANESLEQLHVYSDESCTSEFEITNATWKSSNTRVATVSNGVVTGVAPGHVIITATSGGKSVTFAIEVYQPVQSLSITPLDKEVQMINGRPAVTLLSSEESFRVKAQYDPVGSTLYDICDLSSTNTSVVTVDIDYSVPAGSNYSYQIVTVQGIGDATLLLKTKAEDGSDITTELDVYVCPKVTLVANGGLFGGDEKCELAVPYNGKITDLSIYSAPHKEGCKLLGWFTDAEGGTQVDITSKRITTETTLYAHWDYAYTASKPVFVDAKGQEISGEVPYGTKVYLKNSTYGSEIRYTVATGAGVPAVPTVDSDLYTDAFVITEKTTINATSFKENYKPGTLDAPVVFTVKDESLEWGDVVSIDRSAFLDADSIPKGLWATDISDCDYLGKAITPEIRVYFGKKLLANGTDYAIKYANNKNVGTASVTITGKNNYAGSIIKTFKILPLSLEDGAHTFVSDIYATYNGKLQKLQTTVNYEIDGQLVTLKPNTDFTYNYCSTDKSKPYAYDPDACTAVGDWDVYITGKGNFEGDYFFYEHIVPETVINKLKIEVKDSLYDGGNPVAPIIKVTDGKKVLEEGTDYTLSFDSNTGLGTYYVIITGAGEYAGEKTVYYKIVGTDISKYTVEYDALSNPVYDGAAKEFTGIKVYKKGDAKKGIPDGEPLVQDVDYTVRYSNEVNVAGRNKSFMYIEGINGYVGQKKVAFTINPKQLSSEGIAVLVSATEYCKGGAIPDVAVTDNGVPLTLNKDYTLKVTNNKAVNDLSTRKVPTVTITGKGNYTGSVSDTFAITEKDIADTDITIADIVYQNKAGICKPKITIKDTDGKSLAAKTDYDSNIVYTYENDTRIKRAVGKTTKEFIRAGATEDAPGEVVDSKDIIISQNGGTVIRATIKGNKNYTGSTDVLFRYVEASVASAKVTVKPQYYTGKEIYPSKSDITVMVGNKPLSASDYRVIGYSNNINKGSKASITIEGLGNYGGIKTANFTIAAKSMNYTVVYDKNAPAGVTVLGKNMNKQVLASGAALTKNAYSIRGYSFDGWLPSFYDVDATPLEDRAKLVLDPTKYDFGDEVILKAQWSRIDYPIFYENMSETDLNPNPDSHNVDDGEIILAEPTRDERWIFKGWYKDAGFKTPITSIPANSVGTITIYAKWEGYYTITYHWNGGAADPKCSYPTQYFPGDSFILEIPRKSGMDFDGWYTSPTFEGYTWLSMIYPDTKGDLDIYAKWVPRGQ